MLQVFEHDDLVDRAERQQVQTRTLAAKRGDIVDRKGRVLATSVDADTIYAVPSAIGDEAAAVRKLCGAFGDCTAKERQDLVERLRGSVTSRTSGGRSRRKRAARVAALNLDGIGFVKESHREYPNDETGGAHSRVRRASTAAASAASSRRTTRRSAARTARCSFIPTHAGTCSTASRSPPTAGSTIELTIDKFLQHIAETRAARRRHRESRRRRHRDRHGSPHRRDPRAGERADLQPERVPRRNRVRAPQSRGPGSVRAGLDVQGRHGVGGDRRTDHAGRRRSST